MSNQPACILVVDDDPDLLHLIDLRLQAVGYNVLLAASGEAALEIFRRQHPRVVITDLCMNGMDGHALFERLHAEAPTLPVIILTAHGSIPDAVHATQRGVFSFLTKPFDGQQLLAHVSAAVTLSAPLERPFAEIKESTVSSVAMVEFWRKAKRFAENKEHLLATGPRGCGKKFFLKLIHEAGADSTSPLSVFHCDAFSGQFAIDQALFINAMGEAYSGTLLIDKIELLPSWAQQLLLPAVVDTGMLLAPKKNTPRIFATTSVTLEQAVRVGSFRSDLYYSLARNSLQIPPLEQRIDDIPLLVEQFLASCESQENPGRKKFSPDALFLLRESPWPGNVQQLRLVVELANSESVASIIPASLVKKLLSEEGARQIAAFEEARRAFEQDYLIRLLQSTEGNVSQAARIAQRNRTEFYKLLSRHAIDPAHYKK